MTIHWSRLALAALVTFSCATTAWAQSTVPEARFTSNPIAAYPPNISQGTGGPMMMLTASRDHTLFAPIYTDYEDIDGDGVVDYTFKPTFKYYGYFDPDKCYGYNAAHSTGGRFEPLTMSTLTEDNRRTCPSTQSLWSGNFLNWATMTRLDVVRKTLYGGRRIEDSLTDTTLEMAALGHDAHAFVKYYSGGDIRDYTPFSATDLNNSGLTLCSRGSLSDGRGSPLLRMARGNYSLWATTPGTVCNWAEQQANFAFGAKAQAFYRKYGPLGTSSGTDPKAHKTNLPSSATDGARYGAIGPELSVRVQACAPLSATLTAGSERCGSYQRLEAGVSVLRRKPIGLLQEFGTSEQKQQRVRAEFGLITGSYDENLRGGQLRKNIGSFNDEVDLETGRLCYLMPSGDAQSPSSCNGVSSGTFATAAGATRAGIVRAFDGMRLFDAGNYNANSPAVPFPLPSEVSNTYFPSWGNPMSEMITQALAYFANTDMGGAQVGTNSRDAGLGLPVGIVRQDPLLDTAIDPVSGLSRKALYGRAICRPMHMLAISSGAVTHDTDEPASANEDVYDVATAFMRKNGASTASIQSLTNRVGDIEGITGSARSVGSASGEFGVDCTLKTIGPAVTEGLAKVAGVCPEAPAVKGTYLGAGAAFSANTRAIRERSDLENASGASVLDRNLPVHALRVKSYAATLSGGVARIDVPIPGKPGKFVYITPESSWDFQGFDGKQTRGELMPGAMLTFRAIHATSRSAAYVVTWNDAQFGGDYDMDIVGFLRWEIKDSPVREGAFDLEVTTDILNQEAGAPGAHGFSVIGTVAETLPTGYLPPARYLTHAGMAYAASSDCQELKAQNSADFELRCGYSVNGMSTGGGSDGYAWPTTYNGQAINFVGEGNKSSSVVKKFLVTEGVADVTLRDPLWYVAKYGSFDTEEKSFEWSSSAQPQARNGASPVNWDRANNNNEACGAQGCADGEPDGYFLARRPELLEERLRSLLLALTQGSNSAPAVSSSQLLSDSIKYTAEFNADGFGGTVKAYALTDKGVFSDEVGWNASELMAEVGTNRVVITDDGRQGLNFDWAGLNGDAQVRYRAALLGLGLTASPTSQEIDAINGQSTRIQHLIQYLRGDRSQEGVSFRIRRDGVMGPIVNSTPWLQSNALSARFFDADFPEGTSSYRTFVNQKIARPPVLWVGANDGMLHGLEARNGLPLMSYVPSLLVARLGAALSASNRDAVALVDGSPFTGDLLVASARGFRPTGATKAWRTYLFSSLGRGGRAVFALDVTDPSQFSSANTAPQAFKWAFSSQDDADLGYQLLDPVRHANSGQPSQIVYLNSGDFGLLVPNGNGSAQGRAALFILSINGPSLPSGDGAPIWSQEGTGGVAASYRKIVVSGAQDSSNGLMGATWVDLDDNGTADIVYAADLRGQIWKFDLRSNNPAEWGSALVSNGQPIPFFTARAGTRTLSITTAPVALFPNIGGTMVSFGTGRAIDSADFPDLSVHQRFFTVWDKGRYLGDVVAPPIAADSATGQKAVQNALPDVDATRTITRPGETALTVNTFIRRVLRRDPDTGAVYQVQVNEQGEIVLDGGEEVRVQGNTGTQNFKPAEHDGWYMEFPAAGEAVISSPLRRQNFLLFSTVRPKSETEREQSCTVGPEGTLYGFNPINGLPIRSLLADGSMDMGISLGEAQKFSLAAGDQGAGPVVRDKVDYRAVTKTGQVDVGASSSNLRLQWREISGMRTRPATRVDEATPPPAGNAE